MESYLAGLLYGDGTCYKAKNGAYSVSIDQHQRNSIVLDKVSELLKDRGLRVYRYETNDNKSRVLVYSKQLFDEFMQVKKQSVAFFESLSSQNKKQFIAGFFDAEGTVTDRIVLYNSDIELLIAIRKFLQAIKVESNIYRFGKIFGLQIYRKQYVAQFVRNIKSLRLLASLVKKHRGLQIGNDWYSP